MSRRTELQAIALEYDGHRAPLVTARGDEDFARRLIQEADRHGVHVARDPTLVALLARVEIGQEIPPELYTAVAVLLSWVYWLEGMKPGDARRQTSP
jgi:flagellar biosynthesis protein